MKKERLRIILNLLTKLMKLKVTFHRIDLTSAFRMITHLLTEVFSEPLQKGYFRQDVERAIGFTFSVPLRWVS